MSLGRALSNAVFTAFIACIFVSFFAGGLVFWGVPKLWEIVKPWIHSVTG